MPIDTRDWYREKPTYWSAGPPPERPHFGGRTGRRRGARGWLVILLLVAAFVGISIVLGTPGEGPGILPSSPFYFMKSIGRGITYAFTFDPADKAALSLGFTNEDAEAILITCSRAQYTETVEMCHEYKADFFNALVWAVKAAKEGGDVEALLGNVAAAHCKHRQVFAILLQLTEELPADAVIDAITLTSAPLRHVIQEYQGTAAAESFYAAVQKDFSTVDAELWAIIAAQLMPETPQGSASETAQDPATTTPDPTTSDETEQSQGQGEEDHTLDFESAQNTDTFDSATGTYGQYSLGLVYTADGVLSGGCYGEFIVLINNNAARNPTYKELLAFLKSDDTDKYPYVFTIPVTGFCYGEAEDMMDMTQLTDIVEGRASPSAPRICGDFAERLHNNAELAGIRAGYVSIDLTDPANGGLSDGGHALNVFQTTDEGTVFIDCTGGDEDGPRYMDSLVPRVELGATYRPRLLFDSEDWHLQSMGKITVVETTWDGEWRP